MRKYERIPSKYTVHVMDFSGYNQTALDHYNKDRTLKATDCKPMNTHGFIDTDDGKEGDVTHLGVGPCLFMRFEEDGLRECATGETQPLHEFIRTFGDRLDTNYMNFERWLDNYATRWEGE